MGNMTASTYLTLSANVPDGGAVWGAGVGIDDVDVDVGVDVGAVVDV